MSVYTDKIVTTDMWDILWYTKRRSCKTVFFNRAIENTVADRVNVTYATFQYSDWLYIL